MDARINVIKWLRIRWPRKSIAMRRMARGKNHAQPRSEIETRLVKTMALAVAAVKAAATEEIPVVAATAVAALVVDAIGYKQQLKEQWYHHK